MPEPAKWQQNYAHWKRFAETPIGAAFAAFDAALGNAWVADQTSNSDKRINAAWAREKETRTALLRLLYEAAGVGPYPES